ncbi:HET-domain-containing protein [Zopfia rhizophila CBS 207.26]|uniref:HET-domain-containing protein n=1 Tax=Zopfia rhizophila CBS 207.26 TaxID=1314779 RepID=A0A6A6DUJ9_9PEZI|nr:HET-domain-containing protein [Zopfia rhizophila CBS 207.26]
MGSKFDAPFMRMSPNGRNLGILDRQPICRKGFSKYAQFLLPSTKYHPPRALLSLQISRLLGFGVLHRRHGVAIEGEVFGMRLLQNAIPNLQEGRRHCTAFSSVRPNRVNPEDESTWTTCNLNLWYPRQWLKDYDTNEEHTKCRPPDQSVLPTRLIAIVGEKDKPTLHLYETEPDEKGQYIALSHPWRKEPFFGTYRTNIEKFKEMIDFDKLPNTFKEVIQTTLELSLRYLWIDFICIIQGSDDDFGEEVKRMEDVFSSAYCVIAARCATGQQDRVPKSRSPPDWVTFRRGSEAPFFVCRTIDDFNNHVIKGGMNKRGWVLQERALSHRTIYFTERQTYWECGQGVRYFLTDRVPLTLELPPEIEELNNEYSKVDGYHELGHNEGIVGYPAADISADAQEDLTVDPGSVEDAINIDLGKYEFHGHLVHNFS